MLEVKGTLAKLLAEEDIIVEMKQVDTASFDVEKRVLTLPLWEKADATIVDMLIAHEVGHARYTPNEWDFLGEIPLSVVNVVEDVRIERLMKRRYAGLPKTFYNGYKDINKKDFFQLRFVDLEELGLADRINIFHKVGMFHNVPFNNDLEIGFRDECLSVETFEEVLDLARRITKYQQEQVSEKSTSQTEEVGAESVPTSEQGSGGQTQSSQEVPTEFTDTQGQGTPTEATQENGQESEGTSDEDDTLSPAQPEGHGSKGGKTYGDDLEAVTDSLLSESIQNLVDTESAPSTYINTPDILLDRVVVETSTWVQEIENHWNQNESISFLNIDEEWNKYKTQATREVNYLVKEFECKKAASAYARTTVSKTGVLDCAKLFQYKYNDDIFKKISVTPDGKNHGLIFNLDWSGSMSTILFSTMKQLLNLIQFCNKVGIPFEVYAFTNEWEQKDKTQKVDVVRENEIIIDNFNMLKFASSELKKKDLEKVMKYMFRLAYAMTWRSCEYNIPYRFYLSGTPLNEAIISMKQIIPIFQSNNKVEKCHVINLTDGEGSCIMMNKKWGHYEYDKLVGGHIGDCQLRDRKVGRIYKKFGYDYYGNSHTDIFIENLRDHFPHTNFISIRLCSGNDFNRVSHANEWDFDKKEKNKAEWRKHKSFIDFDSAYTRSLYIQSNSLDDADNEFTVKEDARKQDISRAFKKSLKNKKTSKRILNEFISVIA
jgi:hypothetical protein